jgi:hypothetical protein
MPRRKTPADYHALAEKRGFRWLGPEVPNVRTRTTWECEQGHRWEAVYSSIQSGTGCPSCAGNMPKTPADYFALAEERGFRWLGPEVPNVITKTGWECENGHRWEAIYDSIRSGTGCPFCYGNVPKMPADYQALAEDRGFRWLGPEVPNTATKTEWECAQGHRWEATYTDVRRGSGCPFCCGNIPKKPADYFALAAERGFRWLGPEVPNVVTKTGWECEKGHRWEAIYSSIQRGTGCPVCATERIADALRRKPQDYQLLAERRGFRWLGPEVPDIHTKTGWKCKQGHQWEATYGSIRSGTGCPCCAGNMPKTPADYLTLAEERGFRWLGPEVPNVVTKTGWECEEGHQWEAIYDSIRCGTGCPFCAGRAPKTPEDYQALAEDRGFRWLGPEVPNTATKTEWECVQGHRWKATYANIRQGTGCPFCAGSFPKTPADYQALAKERGFCWLGPEVPNTATKTEWECAQGHRWEATYGNIQQGKGCPFCAGAFPKRAAEYYALAEDRGFRWLGPQVSSVHALTSWECEEGHRWEATFTNVRRGTGCPFCYGNVAETRGFRWLGPEVPNTNTTTTWGCGEGHRWEATYGNILQGKGCPFCAGLAPKTPADYHTLAEQRGFRWLGPEVPNTTTKTTWMCEQGHQWETAYGNIQQGTGCPVCVDMVEGVQVSKIQRNLCEMLGGELNRPFGPFRIDIALEVDGVAIAVEYDSWFWHGGQEEHDAWRDREMIEAGWRVLRVRSNTQLPTGEQLDEAINCLLAGETQVEVVLDDWGIGSTKFDVF